MTQAEGYARALFSAALQEGALERVLDQLGPITELLSNNKGFFYNPETPSAKQISVLRETLTGQADPITLEFLVMLARRRRLKRLPDIWFSFERLASNAMGLVTVKLYVPYELNPVMLDKMLDYLVRRGMIPVAGRDKAVIRVIIDKTLQGGFIAEQGGQLLNLSLRSRLAALRKQNLSGKA